LGTIVEALLQFIPRLKIIRATHEGVRWRRGKYPIRMKPGLHVWWPLTTEIEEIVIARQTINLASQALETRDDKQVVAECFCVYRIYDVVKAIGEKNYDVDSTICDITQAAVVEFVMGHTLDELKAGISDSESRLSKELTTSVRKRLRQYGVSIQRCGFTDFATAKVYRVIGNPVLRD
jgi:regulator of protease activity HflC (stomatin/prohibitin superfamily)